MFILHVHPFYLNCTLQAANVLAPEAIQIFFMKSTTPRSNCPISFSLDVLGDKWVLLILRDMLFKGKPGVDPDLIIAFESNQKEGRTRSESA